MTHILILYDGQVGEYNLFEKFVKWINSLRYDVNVDGVVKTYGVEPRIMVPLNLRVCDKAKDQLLSDLKRHCKGRSQELLDKLPRWGTGIKKIDMSKVTPSTQDIKIGDSPKNIHIGHVGVIGEIKDTINQYGEESL